MTSENEALIAEAEHYIAATFDNSAHEARMLSELIAALRAADERERELVEALKDIAALEQHSSLHVTVEQEIARDALETYQALRGES